MDAPSARFVVGESLLGGRINRVLDMNSRALGWARADQDDLWEQLAGLMRERQDAIEAVFALPIAGVEVRHVREMADSVRETDREISRLAEQRKLSIVRQYLALAQGQHAQSAYLAGDKP